MILLIKYKKLGERKTEVNIFYVPIVLLTQSGRGVVKEIGPHVKRSRIS